MSDNMEVFVITHKKTNIDSDDIYTPLFVGASNNPNVPSEGYLRDDVGENISGKNSSYCELTGAYWIWKNVNKEVVGLVHYRRFFVKFRAIHFKEKEYTLFPKRAPKRLDKEDIERILANYSLIVKTSGRYLKTNDQIFKNHNEVGIKNWNRIEEIISNYYPDYTEALKKFSKGHYHINCNMFIGEKAIIDEYFAWLFDILEKLDTMEYEASGEYFNKRELGYVGEMLFSIWLNKNKPKYKIVKAINTEQNNFKSIFVLPIDFIKWLIGKLI